MEVVVMMVMVVVTSTARVTTGTSPVPYTHELLTSESPLARNPRTNTDTQQRRFSFRKPRCFVNGVCHVLPFIPFDLEFIVHRLLSRSVPGSQLLGGFVVVLWRLLRGERDGDGGGDSSDGNRNMVKVMDDVHKDNCNHYDRLCEYPLASAQRLVQ